MNHATPDTRIPCCQTTIMSVIPLLLCISAVAVVAVVLNSVNAAKTVNRRMHYLRYRLAMRMHHS